MDEPRMFGIDCQIVRKDMSFHAFVQEYGQPYGVTVESLLVQASASVSPLQRQHSIPEPEPEQEAADTQSKVDVAKASAAQAKGQAC